MKPGQIRQLLRAVHLVLAVVAGIAIYAPVVPDQSARLTVAIAVPILAITGVAMWKQAKLHALLKRRTQQRAGAQ